MPLDWLIIASVIAFGALVLLVAGWLVGGVWRERSRIGCAAIGMLSAAIVSLVFLALAAMAQAHSTDAQRTPAIYPFLLAAVPLAIAAGLVALVAPRGRRRATLALAGSTALAGCAGFLLLGFIGLLMLAARGAGN